MSEPREIDSDLIPRRARKRHECSGDGSASHRHAEDCPRVIEPGEMCVEYVGETPAYKSGPRMSLACCRKWWGIPKW